MHSNTENYFHEKNTGQIRRTKELKLWENKFILTWLLTLLFSFTRRMSLNEINFGRDDQSLLTRFKISWSFGVNKHLKLMFLDLRNKRSQIYTLSRLWPGPPLQQIWLWNYFVTNIFRRLQVVNATHTITYFKLLLLTLCFVCLNKILATQPEIFTYEYKEDGELGVVYSSNL